MKEISCESAAAIIQARKKCVLRNIRGCGRECEKCDLKIPDDDILIAYDMAIEALKGDDRK